MMTRLGHSIKLGVNAGIMVTKIAAAIARVAADRELLYSSAKPWGDVDGLSIRTRFGAIVVA